MKKQARNRILASVVSLLLVLSLIVSIPNVNVRADSSASTQTSETSTAQGEYGLADNVQDGVILHAWNWSYQTIESHLQEIAEAGYTTIQTSPVQQPKDYSSSYTSVSDNWWKLYQPVSYSIAENSWLGDADDLTSLCDAADDYGIKIICDIVANHLANDNGNTTALDDEVAQYEPTIYNNYSTYIRGYVTCSDDSIEGVVWGNIGMPDVITSNSYIQGRVISLLESCIDCGVDGFRFDAAKHIETSSDSYWASNFWDNVIGTAKSYAKSNKNIDLYCYGEILNTPGTGRSWSSYTSNMSITDNTTGNNVRDNVAGSNASGASACGYNTGLDASNLVLWAESHDTYTSSGSDCSAGVSTSDINKTWAIVASRADASSLYFARPGSANMGQCGSSDYKSTEVSAVNHFHNKYIGTQEYLSSYDNVVMNERYDVKGTTTGGAVLVNVSGTGRTVSGMPVNVLGDGTYTDEITGNTFTVSGGTISGTIGSTGIAVLYGGTVVKEASNTISQNGGKFYSDTLDLTVGLSNATSGTYKVGEDGETVTYTSDTVVTIGEDMEVGDTLTIYLTATNENGSTEASYTFEKAEKADNVNVYFTNNYGWSNVYAYFWGGENPSSAWPGDEMTYVGKDSDGYAQYTIEVPTDVTGIIFNNGSGAQTADITTELEENTGFYISGGSSSAYTVGTYVYSETPEDPTEEITVYFTNNYSWSNVYAYYWGGTGSSVTWPGTEMNYVEDNSYGQAVYSITIPSDVTGIIFNNGSGAQTADITEGLFNGVGFYITGGSSGAYSVETYTYSE